MSQISGRAAVARESARQRDGKFGSYHLDDAGTDADLDMSFLDVEQPDGDFGVETGPKTIGQETPDGLRQRALDRMSPTEVYPGRNEELVAKAESQYARTPVVTPQMLAENLDVASRSQFHVGRGIWTRTCRCGQAFPTVGAQGYDHEYAEHVRSCDQASAAAKAAVDAPLLPPPVKTEPKPEQPEQAPSSDNAQDRLVRLAHIGKLPRSVKSVETTANRLNDALNSPRVAIEAYDDSGVAEVCIYSAQCRCGKPAVRAGACDNLLHRDTAKPQDREYVSIGHFDTGHDLAQRLAPALEKLIERSPNKATTEDLETLSDLTEALADPREKQKQIDEINKAAKKQSDQLRRSATAPAPRKMRGWREHVQTSTKAMNSSASKHGVHIGVDPSSPDHVFVSVPVQATFRGEPQFDYEGNPRMRQTGFLEIPLDPTDREQMGDIEDHVRSQVEAKLNRLRDGDSRYTKEAQDYDRAAAQVYAAWLDATR